MEIFYFQDKLIYLNNIEGIFYDNAFQNAVYYVMHQN